LDRGCKGKFQQNHGKLWAQWRLGHSVKRKLNIRFAVQVE